MSEWWNKHPTRKDRVVSQGDIRNGSYVYVYEHLLKSTRLEGKIKPTAQEYLDSLERQIRNVSQVCKGSGLSYNNSPEVLAADLAKRKENLHQCLMAFEIEPRDSTWNGSNSCHCHPFGYIASNVLYMRRIKKEYFQYKKEKETELENRVKIENIVKEKEEKYIFKKPEIKPTISPEIISTVVATSSLIPLGIIALLLYSRTGRK